MQFPEFFRTFIRKPRKLRIRGWMFQVHLWTGLGVGLYILAMSLSGSALVFREELEAAFPAQARTVEVTGQRASYEAVREAATSRYPGYRVAWIHEPERTDQAHDVWVEKEEDSKLVLISPYGARFLSEVGTFTSFWTFLQDLHFYLFAGRVGFFLNGFGGLLLGLMCLSGLVIWWPGIPGWRKGFSVKWRARWKRLNWDLHSAGGIWLLVFVATWATTGAYFAFPQPFAKAVAAFFPLSPEVPQPRAMEGQPQMTADTLVRQALQAVAGHRLTWLGLPHHQGDTLASVQLVPNGSYDRGETTTVYLNAFTAAVIEIRRPADTKLGDRVLSWFGRLHFGDFGGWPIKLIWVIAGLSPAALFVTGFLMWWNRVLSKRWQQSRIAERESKQETKLLRRVG